MKKRQKISDYGIILFTLCFTIMIFGPIEIFLSNRSFFWFNLFDVLYFAIPYFVSIILLGLIAIFILNHFFPTVFEKIIVLVFGLSLATYVQGNFVLVNYGQLDGSEIQWEKYKIEGIVSVSIWVLILLLVYFLYIKSIGRKKKEEFFSVIKWLSCAITVIQLVTIVSLMPFNNPFQTANEYTATDRDEFVYSENENFIILLLDRFDSQVLLDILDDPDKDYDDILENFTFYSNTMGMYPCTDLAVPQILSGYCYTNEETYGEYISKAYEDSPLIIRLTDEGWNVGIYTNITLPHDIAKDSALSKIINWDNGGLSVNSHKNLSVYMYKLVGFRYLPQPLKKYCWFYPDDIAANEKNMKSEDVIVYSWNNMNFYNQIDTITKTKEIEKVFKYIHIEGTHEPFTVDRSLNERKETSITEEGRGVLQIVDKYLSKLKEEGIYENANILIMADHGHYDKQQSPLLLVKGQNEKHDFIIDNKSVSYEQLQGVFSDLLDGKKSDELFTEELMKRKYYFYRYKFNLEYDNYATDIVEYESEEDSHKADALHETGIVYVGKDE